MGQYGYATPFTDQWGLDHVNNPPKNPYLGYNHPKSHPYPQIVPGSSNPPFPRPGNQRLAAAHPLPPSSPPSFFVARGFQSSNQQESNHKLQTNHMSRHSMPMRSSSPPPRSRLSHSGRSASLVRYEYNQYGNCEEQIVYDDANQPSNLDRSPYLRRHGSNATRPSLGRPTLRDRSLDRHPSQRPEGLPRLQPPNYEMRSFMPMRRGEPVGDDVEMDNLRPRARRSSLERSFSRGEDSSNHHGLPHSSERPSRQFPSYDMKTFATPRRVEQEDGVDIFEYGPREVRRSFDRPPSHIDDSPLSYSVHRHSEEKRRLQPPNYEMRSFTTPKRGELRDPMDIDPYGVNHPRSVRDVPMNYDNRDERPKFQFPTYDLKALVTPRRGEQDDGRIHPDMYGSYRPRPPPPPPPSMRTSHGGRRSITTENRQSPPLPAIPPVRERKSMESRSNEKRTVPLYFLKKPFDKSTRILCAKDRIDRAKQGIIIRRVRPHRKYCDICERRFTTRLKLAKHLQSEPHNKNLNLFKETIAKIKQDEGDDSSTLNDCYEGKTPKIYCGICKETFINKTRYMEHLKFRRHKVNSRIYEVYKAIKNNTEDKTIKLPSDDPLESFCLYMNSDAHTTLFGEKAEETTITTTSSDNNDSNTVSSTVPDFSKQKIFMRKYLDLRHLLYEEPGPAGEEYIDELDQSAVKENKLYCCSLCNMNISGVDKLENHLHSVAHQEQYKSRVDPQWIVQKPVALLSFNDVVFDVWKACRDKHSRDMRTVERTSVNLQCVCSYDIKTFDQFKQHYPKIFPQNIVVKDSDMHAAAENARRIRSYRNIFRECINILKLFTLPSETIAAKRAFAMKAAKARSFNNNNNNAKVSSSPTRSPPPTTTTPTEPSHLDKPTLQSSAIKEENKDKEEPVNSSMDTSLPAPPATVAVITTQSE
ncbi:unnamed protein product [Schistosoma mattheei]|uniref:C2H2-type domain-containing protein n=1 Tax=Schistosoma mattheei TaxID=31246 RepID=A0AA85AS90_9TREM|nr:unnamed protein product [Schistosoma mattheei]